MKLKDLRPVLLSEEIHLREPSSIGYLYLCGTYAFSPTMEFYLDRTVLEVGIGNKDEGIDGFVITLAKITHSIIEQTERSDFMGGIHSIRCVPGSEREKEFLKLMDREGVKRDLLMCKKGDLFETDFDEYIISDGLYQTIAEEFERIREI